MKSFTWTLILCTVMLFANNGAPGENCDDNGDTLDPLSEDTQYGVPVYLCYPYCDWAQQCDPCACEERGLAYYFANEWSQEELTDYTISCFQRDSQCDPCLTKN